ncbi:MAG: hypothetical protein SGI74_10100 [Oligoflexia bacterium]|nr:hypothetical protein [Oligoflexia bacterium]
MNTWANHFIIISLFILTCNHTSHAEYRVYRLGIKYDVNQKNENEVITSLDHLQYETYYKITPTQQTRLIEHWMCRGRTNDFAKYCAKPVIQPLDLPNQKPGPQIQQAQGLSSPVQRAPAQQ